MMLASHSPSQINLEHEKQARYIEKPEEKIDFIQNETKMLLDLDISSKTEDEHNGRNTLLSCVFICWAQIDYFVPHIKEHFSI